MMLPHCIPQKLPMPGPGVVEISCVEGPGAVDVTGPNGTPVHGSVDVPTTDPEKSKVDVPQPGDVYVHYRKGTGGPEQIDAEFLQT